MKESGEAMQHVSRWTSAVAALCLTVACSDAPLTAPVVPATPSAEVASAPCQAELDALRAAINGATFMSKNAATDQANLLRKVDAAQAKVAEGKTADAVEKLEDIRTTVVALSTPDRKGKTKLDGARAAAIIAAVDAAEACIQVLAATPA
jgi:hypothetical protein